MNCFEQDVAQCSGDIVAGQVSRKVELNSTFGNGSCKLPCNLSRNDFGRCRVCYTLSYLYCSPNKLTQAKKRWGLSATSPPSAVPASNVVTALDLNVGVLNSNFGQTIGGVYIPKFNSSMLCDQPTACSLSLEFKLTRGFSPSTPVSSLTKMD